VGVRGAFLGDPQTGDLVGVVVPGDRVFVGVRPLAFRFCDGDLVGVRGCGGAFDWCLSSSESDIPWIGVPAARPLIGLRGEFLGEREQAAL
jgi:hypothetical protein